MIGVLGWSGKSTRWKAFKLVEKTRVSNESIFLSNYPVSVAMLGTKGHHQCLVCTGVHRLGGTHRRIAPSSEPWEHDLEVENLRLVDSPVKACSVWVGDVLHSGST